MNIERLRNFIELITPLGLKNKKGKGVLEILMKLERDKEVRFTDLSEIVKSHSTLTNYLHKLLSQKYIVKNDMTEMYSLTEEGKNLIETLDKLINLINTK